MEIELYACSKGLIMNFNLRIRPPALITSLLLLCTVSLVALVPMQAHAIYSLKQISAGGHHNAVIKSDGALYTWGANSYGQLGDGTNVNKSVPVQVGSDTDWVAVEAGKYHTVALKSDGRLYSWGRSHYGQLGHGTYSPSNIPLQVGNDTDWETISTGIYHTVAIKSDGRLYAWGWNGNGQLGDGTTTDRLSPVLIGIDWETAAAGGAHTVAINSDGRLYAWGQNTFGQLGDGTTADKSVPTPIGNDNDWVSVAAYHHTLAIKSDGRLYAWGRNEFGNLGDGTTTDNNVPTQVGSDTDWASVTAYYHTVALKSDGRLYTWGRNQFGTLGDGTSVDKYIPTQLGSDTDWVLSVAGRYHSVAVKSDGRVNTWGTNGSGQLGNGTLIESNIPVEILYPPDALTGGPYFGTEGQAINLDASLSSDRDGLILLYEWDTDDGSFYSSGSPTQSHTYLTAGSFTITLTITDNNGLKATKLTTAMICPALPVTEGPVGDATCSDGIDNDCDGAVDNMDGGCYTPPPEYYEFERLWPSLQQPWYFSTEFMAVDSDGYIYVSDILHNIVQKFTSDGQLVTTWGDEAVGSLNAPMGIAVDINGFVYVSNSNYDRVHKYTSDGQLVMTWGSTCILSNPVNCNDLAPGAQEDGDGQFSHPSGLAIDSEGFIYVTEEGNSRVQKFTPGGVFVSKWGSPGTAAGQLAGPRHLAIDSSGFIYVTERDNFRVQKFDSDGAFIKMWGWGVDSGANAFEICTDNCQQGIFGNGDGQFRRAYGIGIDSSDYVYVADDTSDRVQKFTSDGNFETLWGPGDINKVRGLTIDSNDVVYVSQPTHESILKYTQDGQLLSRWASSGDDNGRFDSPLGIAFDSEGFVYVTEHGNHRVQKFTSDGVFVTKWGSLGGAAGQLDAPWDLAIDSSGFIYVVERNSNRVQKFDSDGTFIKMWGWGVDSGANAFEICTGGCQRGGRGRGEGGFSYPEGIAVDNSGFVYVADTDSNRIQKFDSDGAFIKMWGWGVDSGADTFEICFSNCQKGIQGIGDGQFDYPKSIGIDSSGFLYVVDDFNWLKNHVQKFTLDGVYVTKWGSYGSADEEFLEPGNIEIDSAGFIYVVDNLNKFKKFTPDGQFISKFGSKGSSPGMYNYLGELAFNGNKVYTTDYSNNRVQVFRKVAVSSNNKAIIVAGNYEGNNLWDATLMNTNFAYNALKYQGYPKDRIRYFAEDRIDLDNNGDPDDDIYADPDLTGLQEAIENWASGADNLVLYISDHGGTGKVRLSAADIVDGFTLDTWLDAVQPYINGHIIVIIDSCESGSLKDAIKGTDRIILTSTSVGEKAYFINQGAVSYSNFFWTGVLNGEDVQTSHDNAVDALTDAMAGTVTLQNPQLDDTGGVSATDTYIGNGTDYYGTAPAIVSVSASAVAGSSSTITATGVTDSDGIARVWAVIVPPGFSLGASDNAVQGLPTIDLMPTTANEYEATYDFFNLAGTYRIAVYARDRAGDAINPTLTSVWVGTPMRRKAIIMAGGQPGDDDWDAVRGGATQAYNALKLQGYTNGIDHLTDDIYYLINDGSVAERDGGSTFSGISYAVQTWAATEAYDLVLYMIGEGDGNDFFIQTGETVSAATIKGWLDALQGVSGIPGKVMVVCDAAYSGSYVAQLANPSEDRILIGSSGGEAQFLSNGDVSYSKYFWNKVLNGWNVRDAHLHARSAMEFSTGQEQQARLDDDGDGIPNQSTDGAVAKRHTIGIGIQLAGKDPLIGSVTVTPDPLGGQQSATITAIDVTTLGTLASENPVWAIVTHPKGPYDTSLMQTRVDLVNTGGNDYQETTGNIFTTCCWYAVTVYAKDDEGNISSVAQTTVYQNGLDDAFEPDNSYAEAKPIILDDAYAQQHNLFSNNDEDWVKFYAKSGEVFTFNAKNVGTNADVRFDLYDEAGAIAGTPIVTWNSGGNGVAELHSHPITSDGQYYLRVTNLSGVYGNDTGYDLSIYEESGTVADAHIWGFIKDGSGNLLQNAAVVTNGYTYNSDASGYYYNKITMSSEVENHTTNVSKNLFCDNGSSRSVSSGVWYYPIDITISSDGDSDGYGNPGMATCTSGSSATDCNDANAAVNPGAAEVCDGADNNCSGVVDEGYPDTDTDGMANCVDSDDDNDLMPDGSDNCPLTKPARVGGAYFNTMQEAYLSAGTGSTIQCQDNLIFGGDMNLDISKTVTISGGWNCNYSGVTGTTSIQGDINISNGSSTIENIEIEP